MVSFVISWFWCVLGFLAGSGVGWLGVMLSIKPTVVADEAADELPETGARW